MTQNNQNKPKKPSKIMEALGDRAIPDAPPQSVDEITRQAMADANAEKLAGEKSMPKTPPNLNIAVDPSQTKDKWVIAPASSINPQLAVETSTPESQEAAPQAEIEDFNLRRLIDFLHGNVYSKRWVQMHLGLVSANPKVIPAVTIWGIPASFDKAQLVYEVATAPGYVEGVWPYLSMLMGRSVGNTEWAAMLLTTIALFDSIKILPLVVKTDEGF